MRNRHAPEESFCVLLLSDLISARSFPLVSVGLLVLDFTISLFYGRVEVGGEDAAARAAA
jgi:hypothetical protein